MVNKLNFLCYTLELQTRKKQTATATTDSVDF